VAEEISSRPPRKERSVARDQVQPRFPFHHRGSFPLCGSQRLAMSMRVTTSLGKCPQHGMA